MRRYCLCSCLCNLQLYSTRYRNRPKVLKRALRYSSRLDLCLPPQRSPRTGPGRRWGLPCCWAQSACSSGTSASLQRRGHAHSHDLKQGHASSLVHCVLQSQRTAKEHPEPAPFREQEISPNPSARAWVYHGHTHTFDSSIASW